MKSPSGIAVLAFAYDFDGNLVWHRSVIDRFEIPSVSEDGMEYDEDDPPPPQFSLNVSGNHVHTRVNAAYQKTFYVDTYDIESGDYCHSLRIPFELGCGPLFADEASLYMTCEMQIVRFRFPER